MMTAILILARETSVWLDAAKDAVPSSAPQILFALLILAVGVGAGRASQRAGGDPHLEHAYELGAGI